MEDPVLVVVDIIDACDRCPLLGDSVFCHDIGNEIARQSGIGKTVGVRIIQLTKLAAAVTHIHCRAKIFVRPVCDHGVCPPGRQPWLMFSGGWNRCVGICRRWAQGGCRRICRRMIIRLFSNPPR